MMHTADECIRLVAYITSYQIVERTINNLRLLYILDFIQAHYILKLYLM